MNNNDDEKLIPSIKEWRNINGDDFKLYDWIIAEGDIELAIGYINLFYPDFLEFEGCVFLAQQFNKSKYEKWENAVKNKREIEASINHIHLLDLFGSDEVKNKITVNQIDYFGKKLREIFEMKLKKDFPTKSFCVDFYTPGNDELIDYQITFYQVVR
jgi:hypothetical protein